MTRDALGTGLCAECRFARQIRSGRGSVFWMCGRAAHDDRFMRYPRLPVLRCAGYAPGVPPDPTTDA